MNATGLARIECLSKDNYDTWKLHMEALLIKNDAWGYVSGEEIKPVLVEGDAASVSAVKAWTQRDRKAKSDIVLSVNSSELKQIKGCETSREVWLKLQGIYQSKGPARKATLLKQLTLQRMEDGDDVRDHLRKFFDAVDKLSEMDVLINPDLLSIMLLYSLPSCYENFRCAIESRDELPAPETLRVKITEESDARKNDTRTAIPNAMVAGRSSDKRWNFKKSGNDNRSKAPKAVKSDFKFRCHRCRQIGHKAADCERYSGNSRTNAKCAENVSVYASSEPIHGQEAFRVVSDASAARWCLDSGCTSHLCSDVNRFNNITNTKLGKLNLASSASTDIKAKGNVSFKTTVNGKPKTISLNDALHVPDLRTNLLSVGKITDNNYDVLFRKDSAAILDASGNTVFVADRMDGLYYVRDSESHECRTTSKEKTSESKNSALNTWHRRLGHLNVKDLQEAERNGTVRGLCTGKRDGAGEFFCEICVRGKMTRTPFPKRSERQSELLELIHSDVCGPMRVESNGKAKYVVTFIDDYSKWCVVKFLSKKNEVFEAFKEFKTYAENQTGRKIKFLQSDNGTEYCNNVFNNFLKINGIQRRLTVPNNPEQNGIAERKNRTLIEMARCLMLQSNLPLSFWAEAMLAANYIRNRCPTRSLDGKTPHELWTGKIPNVNHFRDFGSSVYCLHRKPNMGKFDARSRAGTFLGYSEHSKAYRVWIKEERRVELVRDVKFVEENIVNNTVNKFVDFMIEDDLSEGAPNVPRVSTRESGSERREALIEIKSTSDAEISEPRALEDNAEHSTGNDSEDDSDVVSSPEDLPRRAPGRPRFVRTGRRGRPRKLFQMADAHHAYEEFAYNAEVPLKQAISSPDADEWYRAIAVEVESLIKNDAWKLVERPKDQDVIGSRVVLRNKYKPDGTLERRKARIVARGFSQRPGIDFSETFAPVARLSSIRLMAALAARYGLRIRQFDVTTAYLNGVLEEQIYMEAPKMLEEALEVIIDTNRSNRKIIGGARKMLDELSKGDKVCLLQRALYGLRQAGRSWHSRLDSELRKLGAVPSTADSCVYFLGRGEDLILITVYVDDILIASRNLEEVTKLKRELSRVLEIKDLGEVTHCLGIEFSRKNPDEILLSQKGYIVDLLNRFGMSESKPVSAPIEVGVKLTKEETPPDEDEQKLPYRELVGALMYLSVATRPDISHAVSALSQFNTCYKRSHWNAAKRILRYLKGTADLGLSYKRDEKPVTGYVDADWASCIHDRRSYTGYAFILSGAAISWDSRKQRTVALSSTESEYMGLAEVAKETIYLRNFLVELGLEELADITVFNDNIGAQRLVDNPLYHSRTKHIDVRHHFVREVVQHGQMRIEYRPTEDMLADVLTKGLSGPKHWKCIEQLGLRNEASTRDDGSRVEGKY